MADDNKQAAKNAARAAEAKKNQKKKKWCPIVAPEMFNSRVIGESLLDDASQLMNKTVTVNMLQLTGDMKRQNVNIMFRVIDVKEGKGLTQAVKFELSPSSLKRLSKRDKDKLTDSFVVKTSDGKLVRIKPLMITNNQTKSSIQAALIKNCRLICKEFVNSLTFETLVSEVIMYKLQKDIRDNLNKTYPLKNFEIKILMLEGKRKKETVEEELLNNMRQKTEVEEDIDEESGEEKHTLKKEDSYASDATEDNKEDLSDDEE